MNDLTCDPTKNAPEWGIKQLFRWKVVPSTIGGGDKYLYEFKDAWVKHNKGQIVLSATRFGIPAELLAGVSWNEVGGDPAVADWYAFLIRTIDWSGPDFVDNNFTITHPPEMTSFGPIQMQLRVAEDELGYADDKKSIFQRVDLAKCLETDVFNIDIAAKHLRGLVDHDFKYFAPPNLTDEQFRVVATRYNRGVGESLESIKKNTDYGDAILNRRQHLLNLLKQ